MTTNDDESRSGWIYPPELVGALAAFGLAPTSATPPVVVRDQLNELYRFELRRMRDRLIAGEIPRPEYLARVVVLRKHYWPLTLPLPVWEKICRPPA
jgi:hypothetical protein